MTEYPSRVCLRYFPSLLQVSSNRWLQSAICNLRLDAETHLLVHIRRIFPISENKINRSCRSFPRFFLVALLSHGYSPATPALSMGMRYGSKTPIKTNLAHTTYRHGVEGSSRRTAPVPHECTPRYVPRPCLTARFRRRAAVNAPSSSRCLTSML